jgi:hypothetical protein
VPAGRETQQLGPQVSNADQEALAGLGRGADVCARTVLVGIAKTPSTVKRVMQFDEVLGLLEKGLGCTVA